MSSNRYIENIHMMHYGQHFRGNAYNSSPMVPTLYPPHYAVSANQPVLTSTPNLSEITKNHRQETRQQFHPSCNAESPDLTQLQYYPRLHLESPDLDTMLRKQVQDYITLGIEKKLTDFQASKDTTKILKDWLKRHRHNPYPSKTEKVMLAYSTQMTMTQISNWFANARRRIKQQRCEQRTSGKSMGDEPEMADASMYVLKADLSAMSNLSKNEVSINERVCKEASFEKNPTLDSGFESFIDVDNDSNDAGFDNENQKNRKCKTNLFGTDPVSDVTVQPLDEPKNVQGKTESSTQKNTRTKKIWSVADILDQKH